MDTRRMVKEQYERFDAHKFDNLVKMDQFLERQKLPSLKQGQINKFNRFMSIYKFD